MSSTSGFVDDVMFAANDHAHATCKVRVFITTHQAISGQNHLLLSSMDAVRISPS